MHLRKWITRYRGERLTLGSISIILVFCFSNIFLRLNTEVLEFQLLNLATEIDELKESIKKCKADVEAKVQII